MKDEQQYEESSSQTGSEEVEASNAETSDPAPVTGAAGDWEETEVPVEDGTDDAGYGEPPEPTPAEQFADSARTQAGAAGDWEETEVPVEDGTDDAGFGEPAEPTPAEQFADSARTQAGAAATALRRGEFMHSAAVDISADGDDRLIALLCYVTQVLIPVIMPILVLLSASGKKRPFQRFHAIQSLALSMTFILFVLLMSVASTILAFVPIIGWLVVAVVFCLGPLLALMGFLALAYYGYQAYQGKRFAIPGLTSFLQDQDWI